MVQRQHRDIMACPHCGSERTVRWGSSGGVPRHRCGSCRHTFNALTKTPLARLRYKRRWLTYVGTMVEHKSIRESAAACGVSATTSFRWHRRFVNCSSSERVRILSTLLGTYSSASSADLAELSWCKELLPLILSWIV